MILFIDNDPSTVLEPRIQFYRMGIHSHVLCTDELERIPQYPVQVVLIMRPECIENLQTVCRRIRNYGAKAAFAMMYRPPHGNYYLYKQLCDEVFEDNVTTLRFAEVMFDIYERKTNQSAYERIFGGLYINIRNKNLHFNGETLPISHEQWMLTRYLLLSAPFPVSSEELRLTCFSPQRLPRVQNVSTQICRMNHFMNAAFERPLVYFQRGCGYYLSPI